VNPLPQGVSLKWARPAAIAAAALVGVLALFRSGGPPLQPTPPTPTTPGAPARFVITFLPSDADPAKAADLACMLEAGAGQSTTLGGGDRASFLAALEEALDRGLNRPDAPKAVAVYTVPYPGEGVFAEIRAVCGRKGLDVTRIDGPPLNQ
jgi:hypothetical protein